MHVLILFKPNTDYVKIKFKKINSITLPLWFLSQSLKVGGGK